LGRWRMTSTLWPTNQSIGLVSNPTIAGMFVDDTKLSGAHTFAVDDKTVNEDIGPSRDGINETWKHRGCIRLPDDATSKKPTSNNRTRPRALPRSPPRAAAVTSEWC
jgi:hypothetical protein